MKLPLQIVSRDFELTDAIRTEISKKADKLDKFYDGIMRCRVVLETPHRHKQEGILYNVRIEMTIPGNEIVVKREPNEDLYVAIRQTFDAAGRKIEDYARKQRGDVKRHEEAPVARVSSLFPDKGYGFLTTGDGREIYFHRNSVLNNNFKSLKVGTEVRFAEEQGDKGPQASSVAVTRL
ncbi:MAG: HPF/RaiA family ribosome-associated protein [Nitrospiraceae bacterium]|nr:HPF/RaiA family ribosome-associated protein [Nitrospiraceae bacterium]